MKRWCFGLCGLLLVLQTAAQTPAYFQQRVDTRLSVTLDDKRHFLHGAETLTYTNNSPDTLSYIYFHLYPNAYSSDRTAYTDQAVRAGNTAHYFSRQKDRGYIDSLSFQIDGRAATYTTSPGMPDVARLDLPVPIPPGATAIITTPFRVKIPKVTSRLGHSGQAYYISQWFPKPAVYDMRGWHPMPYLDQGEFYSEIGSYEVDITLPQNYVVMATGNCTDAAENSWMDSLAAANPFLTKTTLPSRNASGRKDSIPPSASLQKTIHFTEDNIHDFAFFADKRFYLRKDTVAISGGAGIVTVWAAYLPSSNDTWWQVPDYLKKTVTYLSGHVGAYPYKTIKMAEGDLKAGGGMEYPTVAIIDRAAGKTGSTLMTTIVHEAGHNWFQGILATNERDHAWMDEGINTYYQYRIEHYINSFAKKHDDRFAVNENYKRSAEEESARTLYFSRAVTGDDLPMETTSAAFDPADPAAYGIGVYYKPAMMLQWLEASMGKNAFDSAMRQYFKDWAHRHPYPADMQAAFRSLGYDANWFYDGVLNTKFPVDFKIKKVQDVQNRVVEVSMENKSHLSGNIVLAKYTSSEFPEKADTLKAFGRNIPVRVPLEIFVRDSLSGGGIWEESQLDYTSFGTPAFYTTIRTSSSIPDARPHNNTWYRNTHFHHKPFAIRAGLGLKARDGNAVYLLPAAGYNVYDGFMIGGVVHNLRVVPTKLRYAAIPLYAAGSKTLAGLGSIGYFSYPRTGALKEIVLQADVKSFHYNKTDLNTPKTLRSRYTKIAPSLLLTFRKKNVLQTADNSILLKGYGIREEYAAFTQDLSDSLYKPHIEQDEKIYGLLRFVHANSRTFNPFSYAAEAQVGRSFAKLSLEGRLQINYNVPAKSFYIRAFAGKFIRRSGYTDAETFRYWLTTTHNGQNDYLYDETYFGRYETEGIAAQQVSAGKEGGFGLPTPYYAVPLGRSDNYLLSLNLKTDLPLKSLPLRAFLDIATYANAAEINPSGAKLLYEGGLELSLGKRLTVRLPLVLSKDYKEYLKSVQGDDAFWKRVTFSLNLGGFLSLRSGNGDVSF